MISSKESDFIFDYFFGFFDYKSSSSAPLRMKKLHDDQKFKNYRMRKTATISDSILSHLKKDVYHIFNIEKLEIC